MRFARLYFSYVIAQEGKKNRVPAPPLGAYFDSPTFPGFCRPSGFSRVRDLLFVLSGDVEDGIGWRRPPPACPQPGRL